MRTSTVVPGDWARISRIVAAKSDAPPSGSSSRFTLVTTAWPSAICATAAPTRAGSSRSTTPGRPVFTAQKPHERVQVSPRIMKVAVPAPQHSAMFGQWASSQTVWSDFARISLRRFSYSGPIGRRTLSHSGRARSIGTTALAVLRPRERGRSTSPGISNLIGASSFISSISRLCRGDTLKAGGLAPHGKAARRSSHFTQSPGSAGETRSRLVVLLLTAKPLVARLISIHRHRCADGLEPVAHGGKEARRGRPIDDAVIEADDDVHHLADRDRVIVGHHQTLANGFRRQDRGLAGRHDGARHDRSQRTRVVQSERAAGEIVERETPGLGAIDDVADGPHQAREALTVRVLDDRDDETVLAERHRIAQVELAMLNEPLIRPARIDRWHRPQRLDDSLRDERRR